MLSNPVNFQIVRWLTNCFVGFSDYFIPKFGRKTLHLVAVVFIVVAVITISILYTIGKAMLCLKFQLFKIQVDKMITISTFATSR